MLRLLFLHPNSEKPWTSNFLNPQEPFVLPFWSWYPGISLKEAKVCDLKKKYARNMDDFINTDTTYSSGERSMVHCQKRSHKVNVITFAKSKSFQSSWEKKFACQMPSGKWKYDWINTKYLMCGYHLIAQEERVCRPIQPIQKCPFPQCPDSVSIHNWPTHWNS